MYVFMYVTYLCKYIHMCVCSMYMLFYTKL